MHDPFNASVQCGPVGAASICTSGLNSDVDLGDVLSFTGQSVTEGQDCDERALGELEENRALVLNFENRVPVRIIRSYNLSNEYSPKTGYRYDGLYMVVDYWIAVAEQNDTRCYKFALKRLSHQEPPAWKNVQTKYPVSVPDPRGCSQNCSIQRLATTPVSRGEKSAMRLRNRESKTVKSVRKRRQRSNEGNTESESVEATTPTTTMLLHALPGRKIMSDNKSVNVSAIVTRRVSKKLQKNSIDKLPMQDCTVKFGIGELQSGSDKGDEDAAQSQSTRLQNTNISIRTDLYDSSHNLKQSVKKCGSQAALGLATFKPRLLPVQRINFPAMESGPGSSRTISCVKMERVKAIHEAETERLESRCSEGESDTSTSSDLNVEKRKDEEGDKTEFCEPEATGSLESTESNASSLFKGFENNSWPESSVMMNSLTLENVLDIISDDKSSPMAKMLISNVIGADPFSQGREIEPRNSSRPLNTEKTPSIVKMRYPERPAADLENSGQQRIIEIVYSGEESNLAQEESESRSSKEKDGENILRVKTPKNITWPLRSKDVVDFSCNKPGLMMRGKKCAGDRRLWKATNDKIPEAKIVTRSRCVHNTENRDTNSRIDVVEADATGREKPTSKMKSEVANLFIDMNMSPSSQMSRLRSRRSLLGANYSRRRTCPAAVDRGRKRRSDEPVKHPSSQLKRLKKSVVKIQNSSGKIIGAVISKKGLSLRKKTNHLNNNNNNNNNTKNNNNNSVKRISTSEKSTMMNKKRRQNLVEKKNAPIPKRRDTTVLTRSRGSITVGRLRLRRTLLPGVENYPRKKKKTKKKQKPTDVEKGVKRKMVSSGEQKPAKKGGTDFGIKKAKLDYEVYKTSEGGSVEKPKMVSVMTQCSLIPDNNRIISSPDSESDRVKNENIELIEIKSEALDDDVAPCDEDDDEDTEENQASMSLGLSQSLGSLNESESNVVPKKGFIRYVAGRRPRPSAFVPVKSVEGSLRIAQLKSIGFKPIKPDGAEGRQRDSSDSPKIAYSSAVVKRGVQEEYNKYTSEENNVVQYMDSKLCYEDIENEDVGFTEDDMYVDKIEYNDVEEESNSIVRDEEEEEDEEIEFSTNDIKDWENQIDPNSSNSENIEQNVVDSDSDVPWHGWRKIGSNKESHFVGW